MSRLGRSDANGLPRLLIAGLAAGLSVSEAGRIGAAAGACCVTAVGASGGISDFNATAALAGVELADPDVEMA